MLTQQEALERAWDLIHRQQIRVRRLRSVQIAAAPGFLPEWATRGDVWEVMFDLDVPPGMSPDATLMIVDRETGDAAFVQLT